MFRFHPETIQDDDDVDGCDIVRAIPSSPSYHKGQFDTVIVIDKDDAEATGMEGKCDIYYNSKHYVLTCYRNTRWKSQSDLHSS